MSDSDYDLNELLTFDSTEGIARIMGDRVLLFDAAALGLLRTELINTLGFATARMILTRFGYAHGWRTAEVQQSKFPELFADERGGARIHKICGLTLSYDFQRMEGTGSTPLFQVKWANSYEVEQHLLHLGRADEPVCWTLTGYASGYESYKNGREVYFIESKCIGKGDAICQMQGKYKESWGPEFSEQLSFYSLSSVDEVLKSLTNKLKLTENRLSSKQRQLGMLEEGGDEQFGFVVRSKPMKLLIDLAKRVSKVDSSVVVMGQSGVGKERISRLIHDQSARASKPFVAVNCGALTETLLETELFGHAKGAFTGASRDRAGLFEEANGGTLFLDEIGEVTPAMQVRLLRVLQENEVRRVGENRVRPVDVRIIAATNRNLTDEVSAGRFRRDLYYRLCVIEVVVPPLSERPEDILALASHFLRTNAEKMKRPVSGFSPLAAERLLSYSWPGNVRELHNVVERSVALCHGKFIELEDFPVSMQMVSPALLSPDKIQTHEEMGREYILAVVRSTGGDKRLAAKKLGIGLSTLYRKLAEYGYSK